MMKTLVVFVDNIFSKYTSLTDDYKNVVDMLLFIPLM